MTITNCPMCGSPVKVGGKGMTHYFIPTSTEEMAFLPCPFCGSTNIDIITTRANMSYCCCLQCGARGPEAKGNNSPKMAWNTRVW